MAADADRRRRGRPPADEPQLSRPAIVAAAVKLVETGGLEQLTMRRLARALGSDPMALYRHLPNKQALVEAVIEDVFSAMEAPAPTEPWQRQVRHWCTSYRGVTRRYPGIVLGAMKHAGAVQAAARLIAPALNDALAQSGLSGTKVETAAGVLVDYVNGFTIAESGAAGGPAADAFDKEFSAGLDFLLSAIEAMRSRAR